MACLILSEESEIEVVQDAYEEVDTEDLLLRNKLQKALAKDHAMLVKLRGQDIEELGSESDSVEFDDSLVIQSWRNPKDEKKKAKKEKKRLKKQKKKEKKTRDKKDADIGWAEALAKVQALNDPNAQKKKGDGLTPKQRRRLRAIKWAEEAARIAFEEKKLKAASWRENRDQASSALGIMPKLKGARPKKKAKTKAAAVAAKRSDSHIDVIDDDEDKDTTVQAETTDAVPMASPKSGDQQDSDAAGPGDFESDAENGSAASAGESEVERDGEENDAVEKKPSDKKIIKRAKRKAALKKLTEQMTEAMELASSGAFLDYDLFDPQKAYEVAYGKRLEDESSSSDSEEDSEGDGVREHAPVDIREFDTGAPKELLPRSAVGDNPGEYVEHFVRYVMGEWKRHVDSGTKIEGNGIGFLSQSAFNSPKVLKETMGGLIPLLVQCRQKSISQEMLKAITGIVNQAAERDYAGAIQQYMLITMGRKTWHQTVTQVSQQQNHGGAISKILQQSEFVEFDWDPVVKAYTIALKRVIQFAQWLHPPENSSKGSLL